MIFNHWIQKVKETFYQNYSRKDRYWRDYRGLIIPDDILFFGFRRLSEYAGYQRTH